MLHSQVTPLLFTKIKHETYTVEIVAHACFSNNGDDDIDDAYVYEMKCTSNMMYVRAVRSHKLMK